MMRRASPVADIEIQCSRQMAGNLRLQNIRHSIQFLLSVTIVANEQYHLPTYCNTMVHDGETHA